MAILVCAVPRALGQTIDPNLWGTDGTVTAIARSGNTLYIGGAFSEVGPNSGNGVPVDRRSGKPAAIYPKVLGDVAAVAPDGGGGWFIGGSFVSVGGQPHRGFAHILGDGSVAPWDASVNPEGYVGTIAVSGGVVYVGGAFGTIAGKPRHCLAAVDASTGRVLDWDPNPNAVVHALLVDGDDLYVGGEFNEIGGRERNRMAVLDRRTAIAQDFDAHADDVVSVFALKGHTLYMGGAFRHLGGAARHYLGAVDTRTGMATPFHADVAPFVLETQGTTPVTSLAIARNMLYIAGAFVTMDGESRNGLAAFNLGDGSLSPWDPGLTGAPFVWMIAAGGNALYVVGNTIQGAGASDFSNALAVDLDSARITDWKPRPNSFATCLAIQGDRVYLGGEFHMVWNWQPRQCLAAIDVTTGQATAWNPRLSAYEVEALVVHAGVVYVGGLIFGVGQQHRSYLAAIDSASAEPTSWDPNANDDVWAMTLDGNKLYVGGKFLHVGGADRLHLACLDLGSGAATSWRPDPDDFVTSLVLSGNSLYAGGWFRHVGGADRLWLGAVDTTSGAATPWNPESNSLVTELASDGGLIFALGLFTSIGGAGHSAVAALDPVTGRAAPWNDPELDQQARAVTVHDGVVYLGGFFTRAGGAEHRGLVALDAATGAVLPWSPQEDGVVWSLAASGATVYVGGSFSTIDDQPHSCLAALSVATWSPRLRQATAGFAGDRDLSFELGPSPCSGFALVRFSLRAQQPVSLGVFDVTGRRLAGPLSGAELAAGDHVVTLNTAGWRPGTYLCRLQLGKVALTRKLLVVH